MHDWPEFTVGSAIFAVELPAGTTVTSQAFPQVRPILCIGLSHRHCTVPSHETNEMFLDVKCVLADLSSTG